MLKQRFTEAFGLLGKESAWEFDNQPVADFGNVNLAGAGTVRTLFCAFPLANPAHLIKSPDNHPFESPGGTLAATNASRFAGSGAQPIAVLYGAYLVRIAAGGGVYNPVGTTVNVRAYSLVGPSGVGPTTLATFNAAAGINYVETIPIVAPAERAVGIEGINNTTAAAIFDGDTLICEVVTTGALNVQGNTLAVVLQIY